MQIPGYRILQPLGQGGMATVYLAVQESFDRQVALKIMAPELSRIDSAYGERFLREARIVAKLTDPHIVAVYDVGVHNGLHYLAMEYVPGEDLRQHRDKMSLKQCLIAVRQIALALAHAHHQGYVHRDIKPENILIHRHNGRAVLTDFGIARPTGSDDEWNPLGGALGTPSFMSPEQALGQSLDHRSDLYSLGVVSFYLLTGQVPFTGDSPVAISIKHALDAIPRLPTALSVCQPLIDRALAKHPDLRFPSGYEFGQAIDAVLDELTETEQQFWQLGLQVSTATAEVTRVAHHAEPEITTAPMQGLASTSGSVPARRSASTIAATVGSYLQAGLAQTGRYALRASQWLLPQLQRAARVIRAAGQSWWAHRQQRWLPTLAVLLVVVLLGWLLLRPDWNLSSAKQAYRDGELDRAEYNAIIKALKAEHQQQLDQLREALQQKELSRQEYLDAVREAKQDYTGEADCGSWLGC